MPRLPLYAARGGDLLRRRAERVSNMKSVKYASKYKYGDKYGYR